MQARALMLQGVDKLADAVQVRAINVAPRVLRLSCWCGESLGTYAALSLCLRFLRRSRLDPRAATRCSISHTVPLRSQKCVGRTAQSPSLYLVTLR